MRAVEGDLIALAKAGEFDVIVHGCNCFHTWGAGIAKQMKEHFPWARIIDLDTPYGDHLKLGTISVAQNKTWNGRTVTVVNAYTQFGYGGSDRQVDYVAVRCAFKEVAKQFGPTVICNQIGPRIGYPKIGAGLGGGDWEVISTIIDQELKGLDHTMVYLPGS